MRAETDEFPLVAVEFINDVLILHYNILSLYFHGVGYRDEKIHKLTSGRARLRCVTNWKLHTCLETTWIYISAMISWTCLQTDSLNSPVAIVKSLWRTDHFTICTISRKKEWFHKRQIVNQLNASKKLTLCVLEGACRLTSSTPFCIIRSIFPSPSPAKMSDTVFALLPRLLQLARAAAFSFSVGWPVSSSNST